MRGDGLPPDPLRVLDTDQLVFAVQAGSLLVRPLDFAYQVDLLDDRRRVVQTRTFPRDSESTDVRFSGLAYGRYRLQVGVLGSDLQAGGLESVGVTL